VYNVNRVGAM